MSNGFRFRSSRSILAMIEKRAVMFACFLLLCLGGFYTMSVTQLFAIQGQSNGLLGTAWALVSDDYIQHVIGFSFFQAFLSALLSVSLGALVAHALFYQSFFGKSLLLNLFSLSMVLPALVAVFGLLNIYGKSGWLADICEMVGIDWQPNIYGLVGILFAHVFFNLPLSATVFLNSLHAIPNQQRKLASQLGVMNWNFIRLVELPYLRQQLPSLFLLVFMLCFTSFTVVLIMGGSPKYTTLEVAIYQALVFDFELQKGAMIALLQFVFCLSLFVISHFLVVDTPTSDSVATPYKTSLAMPWKRFQWVCLILLIGFIGLPLVSVIIGGLDWQAWQTSLQNIQLYKALGFSLAIASCAGVLSVLMAVVILLGTRQFYYIGLVRWASGLVNVGMMVLAIPTLVLSVGLFLLLRSFQVGSSGLFLMVVLCNALMAMPFALRILSQPFYDNMIYYHRLCQALGISGWARWRLIEWQKLRSPILTALALSMTLSLGDFTAIALFGNTDFTSLPHLLYQQLGNYRSNEANVTAFILLMLCVMIFLLIERKQSKKSII